VCTRAKLTTLTSEYQIGPQKLTCQSYSNQTTHWLKMLLLKQLFQTLQQPYLWWICMSCGQHTSSNTHDKKEIRTTNCYKPNIFSPHHPAKIEQNILLILKHCCTNKSHNSTSEKYKRVENEFERANFPLSWSHIGNNLGYIRRVEELWEKTA